jgi:hypothetical protein
MSAATALPARAPSTSPRSRITRSAACSAVSQGLLVASSKGSVLQRLRVSGKRTNAPQKLEIVDFQGKPVARKHESASVLRPRRKSQASRPVA